MAAAAELASRLGRGCVGRPPALLPAVTRHQLAQQLLGRHIVLAVFCCCSKCHAIACSALSMQNVIHSHMLAPSHHPPPSTHTLTPGHSLTVHSPYQLSLLTPLSTLHFPSPLSLTFSASVCASIPSPYYLSAFPLGTLAQRVLHPFAMARLSLGGTCRPTPLPALPRTRHTQVQTAPVRTQQVLPSSPPQPVLCCNARAQLSLRTPVPLFCPACCRPACHFCG